MIERSFDAQHLHAVASHPEVAPGLANYDFDKLADMIGDRRNVVLVDGPVIGVFEFCAPWVYEVHAIALPEGRGRVIRDTGRRMLAAMTEFFGSRMIWAEPPRANRAVCWLARQIGMKSRGLDERPNGIREIFVWEPALCR